LPFFFTFFFALPHSTIMVITLHIKASLNTSCCSPQNTDRCSPCAAQYLCQRFPTPNLQYLNKTNNIRNKKVVQHYKTPLAFHSARLSLISLLSLSLSLSPYTHSSLMSHLRHRRHSHCYRSYRETGLPRGVAHTQQKEGSWTEGESC